MGQLVLVSGQLPVDHSEGVVVADDIESQVKQCLSNVLGIVQDAGGEMGSLIKLTVFLRQYSDFPAMNRAYESCFAGPVFPARSCVTVADLPVIGGRKVLCIVEAMAVV